MPFNARNSQNARNAGTDNNLALLTAQRLLSSSHQCATELETSLPLFDPSMEVEEDTNNDKSVNTLLLEAVYLAEGQNGLVLATNFTSKELSKVWSKVSNHIAANWNVGRSC